MGARVSEVGDKTLVIMSCADLFESEIFENKFSFMNDFGPDQSKNHYELGFSRFSKYRFLLSFRNLGEI